MPFAQKTFYVAVCDGCGDEHEHDEFSAWADETGAMAAAEDSDWRQQDDGRILCPDCRGNPGGDWYEPASFRQRVEKLERSVREVGYEIERNLLSGDWASLKQIRCWHDILRAAVGEEKSDE